MVYPEYTDVHSSQNRPVYWPMIQDDAIVASNATAVSLTLSTMSLCTKWSSPLLVTGTTLSSWPCLFILQGPPGCLLHKLVPKAALRWTAAAQLARLEQDPRRAFAGPWLRREAGSVPATPAPTHVTRRVMISEFSHCLLLRWRGE